MIEKVELTDRKLANLAPAKPRQRYEIADSHIGGLRVRVGDDEGDRGKAAAISFVLLARFPPSTNPTRRTLGIYPELKLADARELAKAWKADIARGIDPKAEAERQRAEAARVDTKFNAVADEFLKRHVDRAKLRTAKEIRSMIDAVRARLGGKEMADIKRRDLVAILDNIEDERGPRAADKTLGVLSRLFNWWAARDDEFASPIVRGMRRVSASERARKRILSDDELRAFWEVCGDVGAFGGVCRMLLLTGQRRAKVAALRWQDVDKAGTWTIPAVAREKANALELRLPPIARDLLAEIVPVKGNPYVFAGRVTGTHVNGFSKSMAGLQMAMTKRLGGACEPWVLHDLRRTAKSLMARAGVRPDVSERVLGHAIVGVEGVYDRHSYADEKADALAKLAGLVALIVNPPTGNVVPITKGVA